MRLVCIHMVDQPGNHGSAYEQPRNQVSNNRNV
jgi:hypothetical protein